MIEWWIYLIIALLFVAAVALAVWLIKRRQKQTEVIALPSLAAAGFPYDLVD